MASGLARKTFHLLNVWIQGRKTRQKPGQVASVFVYNRQQQRDLRLSGPPSGQGAGGGARTRDRRVPEDLRADSLATVPPTPPRWLQLTAH
ncbi:hypothetical protein PoB_005842200 [Plakobranchus ocellatus]|uniref:Uncharacterized protein n=1 Tax=Plakobranchus ocellatus TaxID=259542 RepID=A0AAV4CJP8_9GAST|nr:hypothetical protein PoB_005842200 [Plakobranchus ocellatus]